MLTTLAGFPSASSIFRPRMTKGSAMKVLTAPSDYDDELFLDCVDKQIDVFDFLLLDRDDTSVSWDDENEDDDDDNSLSCWYHQHPQPYHRSQNQDEDSCCSNASTVYMDALENHYNQDQVHTHLSDNILDTTLEQRMSLVNDESCEHDDDSLSGVYGIEVELSDHLELSRGFIDDDDKSQQDENPLSHVVHFAQHVWEGSKNTPVGLVIHVTEGIFGHVVGMIHRGSDDDGRRDHKGQHEEEEEAYRQEGKGESNEDMESLVPSPTKPSAVVFSPRSQDTPGDKTNYHQVPLQDDLTVRLELTTSMDVTSPRLTKIEQVAFERRFGEGASLAPSVDDDWLPM